MTKYSLCKETNVMRISTPHEKVECGKAHFSTFNVTNNGIV
jgi:hypothetical protein